MSYVANAAQGSRLRGRPPRNKARLNYSLLFRWLLFSVLASGVISYAVRTPYLIVREVKIHGVRLASGEAVKAAARQALGCNILVLRKSPIADAFAAIPEIRLVKIGRRLPDAVWIRVTERKPYAVVTDTRGYCMIDVRGFLFHRTSGPVGHVPLLAVPPRGRLSPGQYATAELRCALEVLSSVRKERLNVAKISVDRHCDICLNMGSDFYVKLGQPDDIAGKVSLLRRALNYKPSLAREAAYIDLSCPSAPVYKPRATAQAAS